MQGLGATEQLRALRGYQGRETLDPLYVIMPQLQSDGAYRQNFVTSARLDLFADFESMRIGICRGSLMPVISMTVSLVARSSRETEK